MLLFLCFTLGIKASKISKAYNALSIYNYFEAKRLFEKSIKKKQATASFGLATIYYRTDNPFSNADSAAKYIAICAATFKDTVSYSGFHINKHSIYSLSQQIAKKGYLEYKSKQSVASFNWYLKQYFFSSDSIKQHCYQQRDSIDFENYKFYESSDSVMAFMHKYPQSIYNSKAKELFDDLQYREVVPTNAMAQLKLFIKNYSSNSHIIDSENLLYKQTLGLHQVDSLYEFINKYSTSETKEQAWKALYSLSVKNYNKEELSQFSAKFPNNPFNDLVEKEISLSEQLLLPLTTNNYKIGFIDTLGNWHINPQYDDVNFFKEGYSAVCKNDSCYYITKDGKRISKDVFDEVENFKQGVAVVLKDKLFYLVNRTLQIISKGYQELNKLSDGLYVCKNDKLYGAINGKGEIVIPFIYNKLGDFKNGYAYYVSDKYGLIHKSNKTLMANWDWVSDVDTNNFAIVKKDNLFGLLSTNENVIIKPQFDFVEQCANGLYLLVKNGLYGFYESKENCYVTNIEFDYNKSIRADDYTNGKYFKLFKNNEVALIDANGRYSINFGTYTNLFFAKCDVIRIQKNNKFGFVDRKLKSITPVEFDQATDFDNDAAIVKKGNKTLLINKDGKVIFTNKDGEIEKISGDLFLIKSNGLYGVVDYLGSNLLATEFQKIEQIDSHFYHCLKNDGTSYLWNSITKQLKYIELKD